MQANPDQSDGVGDICEQSCGNLSIEAGEQCDDGNLINGDGCSSTCMIETVSSWLFGGTAAAEGTIDFTVSGIVLQVDTQVDETPAEVAANVAAAINADLMLQSLGVAAFADAGLVITNGVVSGVAINDSGLTHQLGPAAVPSLHGLLLLLLALATLPVALLWIKRDRNPNMRSR